MKCFKTSILFMFLLSNLAFAAGGGAAAGEGDMPMLDDMSTTRVFFHAEYSLDLELGSPEGSKEDDTREFVKQRNKLKDLYEQMNRISMQIAKSALKDQAELAAQYFEISIKFFEASQIRLAVLKQLAEEGKIELKPLAQGMVSEDMNTYYNNHSLDFKTTRREFFSGHLLLGDSFPNAFEKIAEKLEEISASEDLISSAQKCHTELQYYVKEFKDKNPQYKTVLAQKFILNDFTVIDLFLEMNQLMLKINSALNAFTQRCLEELGHEFFEKFTNKSFVFVIGLSYHVSPSAKEIEEDVREGLRKLREQYDAFLVEGLSKEERD